MTQASGGKFKEQGGIATMDPSPLRRWVISKVMSIQASPARMQKRRAKTERARQKANLAHQVEYFHQVDDGYSHLTAQVLQQLVTRYGIELRIHLVSAPTGANVAEPELLSQLSYQDAQAIAPHYGLTFPAIDTLPSKQNIALAESILAAQSGEKALAIIESVSSALWQNDETKLQRLANEHGSASEQDTQNKISAGNALRASLGHYSGGMFYYGGEWYWGVDRLNHFEHRLQDLQLDNSAGQACIAERPAIEIAPIKNPSSLTLEIYASVRSPYTAIVFDRALQLAAKTGVTCVVRPVLPMVMRGVPATREKGLYILFDTAREARLADVPYGNIYDPIGQPARNCYALYHWAKQHNKGTELLSNFMRAAFADGINTNKVKGLQYVVEQTGLDWQQAKNNLASSAWEQELEENRLTMYDSGLWGVPSFRLLNEDGEELLATWGQDRLWLVAKAIQSYTP